MNPIVTEILVAQINGLRQSATSFELQRESLLDAAENLLTQKEDALARAGVLQEILDESGYTPPTPEEPEAPTPVE